jgi:hypothetical protein
MDNDEFEAMLAQFEELETIGAMVEQVEEVLEQPIAVQIDQPSTTIEPITTEEILKEPTIEDPSFFDAVLKLTEEIYPNHCDLITDHRHFVDHYGRPVKTLLIKFDSTVLYNTLGQSHIVDDLYIAINFIKTENKDTAKYKFGGTLYGCRESVTYAEYHCRYRHSHIRTGTQGFGDLCVGSGTEMSDLLAGLAVDFNFMDFEGLLYQLMDYVAWESLEGVPFFKMSNIKVGQQFNTTTVNNSDVDLAMLNFTNVILNVHRYNIPIKLVNTKNGDKLIINSEDEGYLQQLAKCTTRLNYRLPNGKYTEIGGNISNSEIDRINKESTTPMFKFKNKDVFYKIKPVVDKDSTDVGIKYPNPRIVEQITEKLEFLINDYYNNIDHL